MNNLETKRLIGEALSELVVEMRSGKSAPAIRVGLMSVGSEHTQGDDRGQVELVNGALRAMRANAAVEVVMIGPKKTEILKSNKDIGEAASALKWIETDDCEADIANALGDAIQHGEIAGAVALHYPFPLGTATIGRVVTPLQGREMLIASTTGATATDRVEGMVRNAICGIAVAKSLGIARPTVGILNVDGAPSVNRILNKLCDAGYELHFGSSVRSDGGALLRGNDLLAGSVDVCVTDTLTGNVLMKMFSSWNNGGVYETAGYGYGPSVGKDWTRTISIISRASGAPVIANALLYTADTLRGDVQACVRRELEAANRAGLKELLAAAAPKPTEAAGESANIAPPPAEPTDEEIHGVDVLSIDDATHTLWAAGIYAEASMGCTGPVVKVPGKHLARAEEILKDSGYL